MKKVIEKTLAEFPECRVSEKGEYLESKYVYVRCGNTPLLHNNFIVVNGRKACEAFSDMDSYQQKRIFLETRSGDGQG